MFKVADKIKTHTSCSKTLFPTTAPFMTQCGKNYVQPERPQVTAKHGAGALRAG
jgi:hypothetical protein